MQAEQKALRAQMNPHFIFNALSSIQRFIVAKNALQAHEYLSKFGSLIRHILDNSKHTFISIQEEVETLKLYIELEALRFDNSFEYSITIDPAIDEYNTEIPTMIIQPFVENAIWHGLLHRSSKGKLIIDIQKEKEALVCIIEDNGIGREASEEIKKNNVHKIHASAGMEITEGRLKNLKDSTQSNYAVHIHDLKDDSGKASGTRVRITFSTKRQD